MVYLVFLFHSLLKVQNNNVNPFYNLRKIKPAWFNNRLLSFQKKYGIVEVKW